MRLSAPIHETTRGAATSKPLIRTFQAVAIASLNKWQTYERYGKEVFHVDLNGCTFQFRAHFDLARPMTIAFMSSRNLPFSIAPVADSLDLLVEPLFAVHPSSNVCLHRNECVSGSGLSKCSLGWKPLTVGKKITSNSLCADRCDLKSFVSVISPACFFATLMTSFSLCVRQSLTFRVCLTLVLISA